MLGGYPLLAFAILAAQSAKSVERVVVSTDSEEIAGIAGRFGAEVPFLRPPELAADASPDIDYVLHALNWLQAHERHEPDFLVQLRPTTPLRDPGMIDAAVARIINHVEASSLRSVHPLAESPRKMFELDGEYLAGLFPTDPRPEYYNLPRQAFAPAYHANGYVDILRTSFLRSGEGLHGPRILAFVTPVTTEVDRPEDFAYLEYELAQRSILLYENLRARFDPLSS